MAATCAELRKRLSSLHVVWQILIGAIIGGAVGIALSASNASPIWATWLGMPGYIYLRALKLLVVPLVFCSVITGIASLQDLGVGTGTLGKRTVALYAITTIIGVIEGLVVTYTLYPAWHTEPEAVATVIPYTAQFDSQEMITVYDVAVGSEFYFNSSTAQSVRLRFAGHSENTTITPLYWYARAVNFVLPVVVGDQGPYAGYVEALEVLDEDGGLAFKAPAHSFKVTGAAGAESAAESMSDSFVRLIDSLVPNNLVGIFGGGGGSPDLLSLIVFAVSFAVANMVITNRTDSPNILTPFFQELLDTILYMVLAIVEYTPAAVGALILKAFAENSLDDLADSMRSLGVIAVGWVFAFAFHTLVTMPSIAFFCTRKNPYDHLKGMGKAATLAFGCASSAVTLPVNMACCESLGYQPAIVRFVLSLGATVSMDGTAIYIPGAVIWLAAQAGISLTAGNVFVLSIIATLSSAGASPTPGLVSIVILCWASVFPTTPLPDAIAYIAAVDWFIDRCVTTTNVLGDSFVVRIVDHYVNSTSGSARTSLRGMNKEGKHRAQITPLSTLNNLAMYPEDDGAKLELEMKSQHDDAPFPVGHSETRVV